MSEWHVHLPQVAALSPWPAIVVTLVIIVGLDLLVWEPRRMSRAIEYSRRIKAIRENPDDVTSGNLDAEAVDVP